MTKQKNLHLVLALILGVASGLLVHSSLEHPILQFLIANVFTTIGQLFLKGLFMVVLPMVVSALVLGVAELGGHHDLAGVLKKTLFYTLLCSALSVMIGITLVEVVRPGDQKALTELMGDQEKVEKIKTFASQSKSISETLVDLLPANPLGAMTRALDGEMLQVMIFSLILGIALNAYEKKKAPSSLKGILEELFAFSVLIMEKVLSFAPLAVFSLVFVSFSKFGLDLFYSLIGYVAVVVVGILIQQFVVYGLLLKLVAKRNPWHFFRECREVLLFAFSTASSNATLPRSLELAESKLRLPSRVSRFVLTVGATANQNGTALFEGVTVLFLAQVYGVPLDLLSKVTVIVMSIIAGIGTAGVPGGSLPVIMILLQKVGIPPEGLGLVLGVDRFLDMMRTSLNVSGDLVIATLVSREQSEENGHSLAP